MAIVDVLPDMPDIPVKARRMRLEKSDFQAHGYTSGCPACIQLRRGGVGVTKGHTPECRTRLEGELVKTAAGRARKEREAARKEEELTQHLRQDDERQQKEKELIEKKNNEEALEDAPRRESESKPETFRMDEQDGADSEAARGCLTAPWRLCVVWR